MREHGVPQFTVDAPPPRRATSTCSGCRFSTELGYTNMLTALDLAGIPLHARRPRPTSDPIVVAGGHAAFNPEPIADFIDAAVIGDGEQAVLEITDIIRAWKARGPPRRPRRAAAAAGAAPAASTCPRFYDGRLPARRPDPARRPATAPGVPWRVSKHTVMDLDAWPYPKQPLVPLAEIGARADVGRDLPRLHPRLPVLPGRHDHPPGARALASPASARWSSAGLAATGFEEVGLLSLSSADHSEIADIAKGLADRYEGTQTGLSLPSTRVDAFNIDLANELTRNGRRSGPDVRARGRLASGSARSSTRW